MALRRKLPETTPFFDIGHMSKAPNGDRIPHQVVRRRKSRERTNGHTV
jgi:hypothetical protein